MAVDGLDALLEGNEVAYECEDHWSNSEEDGEAREEDDKKLHGFGGLRATMPDVCEMTLQPSSL